jgi:hypothetical protein
VRHKYLSNLSISRLGIKEYLSGFITAILAIAERKLYVFFVGQEHIQAIPVKKEQDTYYISDVIEWDLIDNEYINDPIGRRSDPFLLNAFGTLIKRAHRWIILYFEIDDLIFGQVQLRMTEPGKSFPGHIKFNPVERSTKVFETFVKKYYELVTLRFLWKILRIPAVVNKVPASKVFKKVLNLASRSQSNQIRGPAFIRILYFAPLFFNYGYSDHWSQWARRVKPDTHVVK